ncbi:MAG: zinc-ribbon domain-containing protein [Lachnospiraceae bacterium]|nr:zinc-ribbon domain-containing protein [Lachnospiraceae bacterium]
MFCQKCGKYLEDGTRFCPSCGTPAADSSGQTGGGFANQAQEAFDRFNKTEDTSSAYSAQQIADGKVMGILAYIGFLVLVPILAEKQNPFVRYHANQGLVLFLGEILYALLHRVLVRVFLVTIFPLGVVLNIVLSIASLVFVAYMVIGIVNVCNGKAKELPVIGGIRLI